MLPLIVELAALMRTAWRDEQAWAAMRARWRGGAALPDVDVLPLDAQVVSRIAAARAEGRTVWLIAEADRELPLAVLEAQAQRVGAQPLSLPDALEARQAELAARLGGQGYDYIGVAQASAIWSTGARRAVLVDAAPAAAAPSIEVLPRERAGLRDALRALRAHQWLKNLLVFVPLLAAHRYGEAALWGQGLLAFLCFGLTASAVYLWNDLCDLDDDRHHRHKRARPLAAGRWSLRMAWRLAPLLLIAALLLAWLSLPLRFVVVLLIYFALTCAYSMVLKRRVVVDVIVLAMLYTLRIIAGAAALGIAPSFWLLAFSMFMFLSLALVKRYAELRALPTEVDGAAARGRGYQAQDLSMVSALGGAAGYTAVLVLALYIHDAQTRTLYTEPEWIWLACPLLLYWISRVWLLAHRGLMHEDPLVFALRDRVSLAVGALLALVFGAAA